MADAALSAADLAAQYGLKPASRRPGFFDYLSQLWDRRHFVWAFSRARVAVHYSGARLGQLWQLLTPIMQAAVYYLVFGLVLGTHRGVDNFIAFLVCGVFSFHYTQRAITAGARSISGNLSLIRALHFPRACLPIGYVLIELQQMVLSVGVLIVICLVTGEPITLWWLLIVPALALQTVFAAGLAMVMARIGAQFRDVQQLLPFLLRAWLYLSGVFYSIDHLSFTATKPTLVAIMHANPAAVFIEIYRGALLREFAVPANAFVWAAAWALVALFVGFWVFWRAEDRYGRG